MLDLHAMSTIHLPFISNTNTTQIKTDSIPFGHALYGVPHNRVHIELGKGIPLHNWSAASCCLAYPSYYPSIHSTLWLQNHSVYAALAEKFPDRTWLFLNEPDNGPPQGFIRPDYAIRLVKSWAEVLRPYGQKIAGYGVTIVPPDHWLQGSQHPWIITGWRRWLDEWNKLKGLVPDVAHIHIYAKTKQQWQDQWMEWQMWNSKNWQLDTIITECGVNEEVYRYLTEEFYDKSVRALLWFTDLTTNPIPVPDSDVQAAIASVKLSRSV